MTKPIQRNTPEEIIAVVQAFLRGETIQYKEIDLEGDRWHTIMSSPLWNFDRMHYRPKPKPREFWINAYDSKYDIPRNLVTHDSPESAKANRTADCIETIHVVEPVK